MRRIYFDNNATTPIDVRVYEAMVPYFQEYFGNPSSAHYYGQETRRAIEDARDKIARIFKCSPFEIYFTSCGTESNNTVIKGVAFKKGKGHIITSAVEHKAVLKPIKYLKKFGFDVSILPVDGKGLVDPDDLKKAIRRDTILISIMYANNIIGTIEPIEELAKIAKEREILFHTDAVQAVGKIPIDLERLPIDFLSISAHKFYGPKGIGVLFVRKGVEIDSLIHGGSHEMGLRAGTENVPYIVGMGKACELCEEEFLEEQGKIKELRDYLEKRIKEEIKDVRINGEGGPRIPNTSNILFYGVEAESLMILLNHQGIAVSTGSACASGSVEPPSALLAIGLSESEAMSSVRISLGKYNSKEEIDQFLEVLPGLINKLRAMTPSWK